MCSFHYQAESLLSKLNETKHSFILQQANGGIVSSCKLAVTLAADSGAVAHGAKDYPILCKWGEWLASLFTNMII